MIRSRIAKRFAPSHESAAFDLNIEFEAGPGVTVLFGPSGSGKTLTLDIIAGLADADSGRIMVNDRILFDSEARVQITARQRRCGYVFQNYALFPHMTLRENLAFAANGVPRLERHRKIGELLERFHLTGLAGRYPRELSGGEQQRASIARALLTQPDVLLLDEPARGLDEALRKGLLEVIQELRKTGIPILLVTHAIEEVLGMADYVLIYQSGKIIHRGEAMQLLRNPGTENVAKLLGNFCFLDCEIRALDPGRQTSRLRILNEELQGPYFAGCFKGDRIRVGVRPEELLLHDTPGQNRLRVGTPTVIEKPQSVEVSFGNGLAVALSREQWKGLVDTEALWVEIPQTAFRQLTPPPKREV